MDAHAVEPGTRPDATPRVLKVGQMAAGFPSGDPPRPALLARRGLRQLHRRGRERRGAPASLGVGRPGSPAILRWWQDAVTVPCVAIGGIAPENCGHLVEAGADFLAVVSAVWDCPDGAAAAVRAFDRAIAAHR